MATVRPATRSARMPRSLWGSSSLFSGTNKLSSLSRGCRSRSLYLPGGDVEGETIHRDCRSAFYRMTGKTFFGCEFGLVLGIHRGIRIGKDMKEELNSLENTDESLKEDLLEVWTLIDGSLLVLAETFEDLSKIQNSYWEAEYAYRTGEVTSEEREDKFGSLNGKASEKLDQMSLETERVKNLRDLESKTWKLLSK